MDLITIKNLKAGYGSTVVLKSVDLKVGEGEIRVILGGSGCGKSTLLNNIIGLETPMEGEISILGEPIDYKNEGIPAELRRKMGVTFQNSALLTSLTTAQNIALPLKIHNHKLPDSTIEEIVRTKLAQVHMSHAYDKFPTELSGGMKKRAALARAIITDPPLLFCDEPSAGLDPLTSKSLDDLLLELRDKLGISIIIVTHELDSIRAICDQLTFLSEGLVLYDGSLKDALDKGPQEVKDFFARRQMEQKEQHKPIEFNLEN